MLLRETPRIVAEAGIHLSRCDVKELSELVGYLGILSMHVHHSSWFLLLFHPVYCCLTN